MLLRQGGAAAPHLHNNNKWAIKETWPAHLCRQLESGQSLYGSLRSYVPFLPQQSFHLHLHLRVVATRFLNTNKVVTLGECKGSISPSKCKFSVKPCLLIRCALIRIHSFNIKRVLHFERSLLMYSTVAENARASWDVILLSLVLVISQRNFALQLQWYLASAACRSVAPLMRLQTIFQGYHHASRIDPVCNLCKLLHHLPLCM